MSTRKASPTEKKPARKAPTSNAKKAAAASGRAGAGATSGAAARPAAGTEKGAAAPATAPVRPGAGTTAAPASASSSPAAPPRPSTLAAAARAAAAAVTRPTPPAGTTGGPGTATPTAPAAASGTTPPPAAARPARRSAPPPEAPRAAEGPAPTAPTTPAGAAASRSPAPGTARTAPPPQTPRAPEGPAAAASAAPSGPAAGGTPAPAAAPAAPPAESPRPEAGERLAALEAGHARLLEEVRALRRVLDERLAAAVPPDLEAIVRRPLAGLDERLGGLAAALGDVRRETESRVGATLEAIRAVQALVSGNRERTAAPLSTADIEAALGRLRAAVDTLVQERTAALQRELAELRQLAEAQQAAAAEAVRALQAQVERLLAPPALDEELEASVTSLRRLLSELVEQRMEAITKTLADLRHEAESAGAPAPLVARLDDLLQRLGAVRFVAEPMDVVDPVIHTVVEERPAEGMPDGLIVATVRPGYRTARGRVLSKAAVAISRS